MKYLEAGSRSSTPTEEYTSQIPADLLALAANISEDEQGQKITSEWEQRQPQPPSLPPHLETVLLNSQAISEEDNSVLPEPNHVTLNHLYASSIKDNVMALSTTTRYRKKVGKVDYTLFVCAYEMFYGSMSRQCTIAQCFPRGRIIIESIHHWLLYRDTY